MGRDRKLLKAVLPALALPMALAACGGSSQPAPVGGAPCPRIAILAEGADLTRYREGGARDLTAMVVDARVTGFEARCDFADRERSVLDVRIVPRFEAERGPAFAANVPRGQGAGQPVLLSMPLTGGRRATDYVVRVSFQLTPEELALNRSRGVR
jgi:hypothetical protein